MASVMAAPNSTRVHAIIEKIDTANEHDGKTEISLKIKQVEVLYGPCFIQVGDKINVFTYQTINNLQRGQSINAEIEYIGDAIRGSYQITRFNE